MNSFCSIINWISYRCSYFLVWFETFSDLRGVFLDVGRSGRIETGVALLEAISDVYSCALAALGDSDRARPSN